jgi:hypothetical protein
MKIDKEKLDKLLALPDDALWAEIVRVASSYGFNLPQKTPPKEQLNRLRATAGSDKINATEAMRILASIRKGKENG